MMVRSLLRSSGAAVLAWCLCAGAALAAKPAADLPPPVLPSVAAREYHAQPRLEGLQAPNRAQHFRTWFDAEGITVVDRGETAQPLLSLKLAQWGRAHTLQPAAAGTLQATGDRVERRAGALTEWYINAPAGLEHGYTLDAPPAGTGAIEFHLHSDQPVAQIHAEAVQFGTGADALRYAHLKVWDSNARILPAQLRVAGARHVVIQVDDTGARYPITVDPLLTRTADVVRTGSQAAAEFGIRIASAGDVNNDGVDDLVVGAFKYDDGAADSGAAFVYLGPAFTNGALLSNGQAGAAFGAGVGGAGDINGDGFDDVVIGAPNFDASAGSPNTGAAYVYFGGSGAFNQVADATFIGFNQNGNMGAAVTGVGDVNHDGFPDLAIGMPRYNPGGQTDTGAAFIYFGGNGFNTQLDATLTLNQSLATVGTSIAGHGDVNGDGITDLVVGAAGYELPGGSLTNEGAAIVYFGGESMLDTSADAILRTAFDGATGGASVALGDVNGDGIDDVLSGAPLYSTASITLGGAVQIWLGANGPFNTLVDISLYGDQPFEQLGRSVAVLPDLDGNGRDEIIAGAPVGPGEGGLTTGKVKLYFPTASGVASLPTLELLGTQTDAQFGTSVTTGDFNGDGLFDVGVGEPGRDVGGTNNHGAIYLYFGQTEDVFKDGFE